MIARPELEQTIRSSLDRNRVVALIGPRQCGKTTLACQFVSPDSVNYFDLEDPLSLARLDQPMTALRDLQGLVVIDEIQRRPELFPILRVLADRAPLPARFLILGSASPQLLHQSSESLAGRIAIIAMSGFSLAEVGKEAQNQLWQRGGFPLSFIAPDEESSLEWRRNFIQTFLERDIPQFGFHIPASSLFRLWSLLAHYHGQIWNTAEAARTLGVGESSARRYVDLLQDLFMVRLLQPWFTNIGKRQVSRLRYTSATRVYCILCLGYAPRKIFSCILAAAPPGKDTRSRRPSRPLPLRKLIFGPPIPEQSWICC